MTHFTEVVTMASQEVAIENGPGTNAGSNREEDQIIHSPPYPVEVFSEHARFGVVFDIGWQIELIFEETAQGNVIPSGKVGRAEDPSPATIYRSPDRDRNR